MDAEEKYKGWIQDYKDLVSLNGLWEQIKQGEPIKVGDDNWPIGKAFEYMILRAFELDSDANVEYPYPVELLDVDVVEQIDGFIRVPRSGIHAMVESKDLGKNISIASIYKLRSQLARRPSNLIGCFFTKLDFTPSAKLLSHFLAPQTILLWTGRDIDFCFERAYFVHGLEEKFNFALKNGIPNLSLAGKMKKYGT